MIDAAQTAFFVAAKEHFGAPMRTTAIKQANPPLGIAKGDQLLAHDIDSQRRAIRFGQFLNQGHGLPKTAEILPHGRIRSGSG